MKLTRFVIERYRNIESATFKFGNYTVLIGPNNQGKTNVLRALELAFEVLGSDSSRSFFSRKNGISYSLEEDYPKKKKFAQSKPTSFQLDFMLNGQDRQLFRKETGLHNNGYLSISIAFLSNNGGETFSLTIGFPGKKGRGATTYRGKSQEIGSFAARHFPHAFIPAIRTEEEAKDALQNLIAMGLRSLSISEDYQKHLDEIRKLEQIAVNSANDRIKAALADYLPAIKKVSISYEPPRNMLSLSREYFDIYVDDSVDTSLQSKGSGVASLAVIALIQSNVSGESLIVVEEPECHLHADAIHEVAMQLRNANKDTQVIVSTHNPSFVPTANLRCVYCVENGTWKNPRSIYDVRKSLGLTNQDSLYWPANVIVLEGEDDKAVLDLLIRLLSPERLTPLLENDELLIVPCKGANRVNNTAALYSGMLVNVVALFDGDQAGRTAADAFDRTERLNGRSITIGTVFGKTEIELEDLLPPQIIRDAMAGKGLSFEEEDFVSFRGKFKRYVDACASKSRISWTKTQTESLKAVIAQKIRDAGLAADQFRPEQLDEWKRIIGMIEEAFCAPPVPDRFEQIIIFGDDDF